VGIVIDTVTSFHRPFRGIVGDAKEGFDPIAWEILSGMQLPRLRFKADWKKNGKAAGPIRNQLMVDWLMVLDDMGFVCAGWDGKSKGTKGTMDYARGFGIDVVQISNFQQAGG
jgi:hypothetical protein